MTEPLVDLKETPQAFARLRTVTKACVEALKAFSPYAWVPILAVGVTSAILAYKNLSLQVSGARPEIIINRAVLYDPYDDGVLSLGFLNVGSRAAYDYKLEIQTVEVASGKIVRMATVYGSNNIQRQAGGSADPRLDMSKFLDAMVFCQQYKDENDNVYGDIAFVEFPNMKRGVRKDQGGGGQYPAAGVSPEVRKQSAKMDVCK